MMLSILLALVRAHARTRARTRTRTRESMNASESSLVGSPWCLVISGRRREGEQAACHGCDGSLQPTRPACLASASGPPALPPALLPAGPRCLRSCQSCLRSCQPPSLLRSRLPGACRARAPPASAPPCQPSCVPSLAAAPACLPLDRFADCSKCDPSCTNEYVPAATVRREMETESPTGRRRKQARASRPPTDDASSISNAWPLAASCFGIVAGRRHARAARHSASRSHVNAFAFAVAVAAGAARAPARACQPAPCATHTLLAPAQGTARARPNPAGRPASCIKSINAARAAAGRPGPRARSYGPGLGAVDA